MENNISKPVVKEDNFPYSNEIFDKYMNLILSKMFEKNLVEKEDLKKQLREFLADYPLIDSWSDKINSMENK